MAYAFAIMFVAIFSFKLFTVEQNERTLETKAAAYANYINTIANGYKVKVIDEESIDGSHLEGLAETNGAVWNIKGADVIYNLQADGTSSDPNHSACASSGVTYGLSGKSYISCDVKDYAPFSDESPFEANFTRTAPATPPAHYTTGYSQIKGVLTFGSAAGGAFSLDAGNTTDERFAYKVWSHLNRLSGPNPSNALLASTTSYVLTAAGSLEVHLDFTKNNEIAIRSDGAIPFTNDQSMGDNSLLDVKSLVWSSVESALDENGNIQLGGGPGVSTIFFDKSSLSNDYIRLTADGMRLVTNEFTIEGDLLVTGTTTFEDEVTFDQPITLKDSGVSLLASPQTIGYTAPGGTVPFPDCVDETRRRIIPFQSANIPTSSGANPLFGFYPDVTTLASSWQVDLYNITEDGTRVNAGADSRIGVITYCDE
ncbi:hypothetical protein [Marinomonas sp. 2405UD68-3]|uniref:hypothetical protein n=1 Tax=Marinomonas sp. 2405UD68-3 TaxID=3391835 RepID=UPI0039C9511E